LGEGDWLTGPDEIDAAGATRLREAWDGVMARGCGGKRRVEPSAKGNEKRKRKEKGKARRLA
jgi:hypothetical protein